MAEELRAAFPLRRALRAAAAFPLAAGVVDRCLDPDDPAGAWFDRTRASGLAALGPQARGALARVTGEVAECVAEIVLGDLGYSVFWQLATAGARGVDLLLLSPDESVLALEVKGTLRAGSIPRLTPSRLRQMSREWLNGPDNPAMREWAFAAEDLYAGVMVVDLAASSYRVALSGDFELYAPLIEAADLATLRLLGRPAPG